MAENSKIEWTDHTFNPWIGCQKVGPGCDHCYAEAWDARGMQSKTPRWGPHAIRTRTGAANWRKPLAWNKAAAAAETPARVFCASLADWADTHKSIDQSWREDLGDLISATPHLDWLLLTKRIGNAGDVLGEMFASGVPRNVAVGITVVNQIEAERDIQKLIDLKARRAITRVFLSIEPMLGEIDLSRWLGIHKISLAGRPHWTERTGHVPHVDWVIVGGESGPNARPMHPDWPRSIRDQCQAAGVPFFFKQWGEHAPNGSGRYSMIKIGKRAAGRLLDGREHNEMPERDNG